MLYRYCSQIPQIPDELINLTEEQIRKIPNKFKLNGFKQKYILKKIAERYFDKKFIYRKKIGFS